MEIYAKRQQLGDEAIDYAHAIKIEALRRLGELLKDAPKNQGAVKGKTGSKGKPALDSTPTLSNVGLDKNTSMVAQRLADLPAKQFAQVKAGLTL